MGAIHGRGYYDRIGLSEACFSGARGRCRGSDGSAQATAARAGTVAKSGLRDFAGRAAPVVLNGVLCDQPVQRAAFAAGLLLRIIPQPRPWPGPRVGIRTQTAAGLS